MGKKRAKTPKKTKRKQPDLPAMQGPGVEQNSIPELDDIGGEYLEKRDERIAILAQEVDAKKRLKAGMEKHGLKVYRLDEKRVATLEPGEEKLKIKKIEDDGADESEEEDQD